MTKSKSLASSIVVSSFFVIHLVNGSKVLNYTCPAEVAVIEISPFTKMQALL